MTTIPLLDHEVRCPDLRTLWRPVKPQPQFAIPGNRVEWLHDCLSRYWCARDRLELSMGVLWEGRCPFGKPDDVVVGLEEWWDTRVKMPSGRPILLFRADRDEPGSYWESAETLPVDLARRRYRIASVAVRRIGEMTEEDAVAWGFAANAGCSARALAWYLWDKRHHGKQWAWVVGVEAI
ncbi:MAG: hypothetical protein PHU85_02010 [Phycisphaerae bacterium]|nr:hypothetical protein [Phycisphaerae bacterium]